MAQSGVWLISGCSTGLGRALATQVIASGQRVVATARDRTAVEDLVTDEGERTLALALDVTDPAQIAAVVRQAQITFGSIDVLVNNAGYGYQASVEEAEPDEIRRQFEVNVFGLFALTRAVLPGMRARRRGHIINITSVAGFIGFPGSGYYAASKHAIEGFSDSLAAEMKPIGISVTCVEPGPFRTDWAGRSLRQTESRLPEYADTAGKRLRNTAAASGEQRGDPDRAAALMLQIADMADPPRHLVLGNVGIDAVTTRLHERLAEIEHWTEAGRATDFPAPTG